MTQILEQTQHVSGPLGIDFDEVRYSFADPPPGRRSLGFSHVVFRMN